MDKDNTTQFKFYEKDTCSRKIVQKNSTMANDLVRILNNTRESMEAGEQRKVVDGYGQKLINSRYILDQMKRS